MLNPRLASRYAKSLIDLAQEQGNLEKVYEDMSYLQQAIKSSKEFSNLLKSPIISPDKKVKIIDAVTAGKISVITTAFTKLLINKGREIYLPEITTSFIQQYKQIKNIHTVHLTTAAPISESLKSAIVTQVKQTSTMQNVELETKVDESLIGGFTLQVGDKLVDASVSYELKELARQFNNNDFIYKVK